ncbi:MAG: PEP-CTERM sorting domain-containing protein [Planctomycetota bacterium]
MNSKQLLTVVSGLAVASVPAVGAVLSDTGTYDTTSIDVGLVEATAFDVAVAAAFPLDLGGTVDFGDFTVTDDGFTVDLGAGDSRTLSFSTDQTMQSATSSGSFGPITPIAGSRAFLQAANSTGWALTFDSVTDAIGIGSFGMTLLPRENTTYPLDAVVTVTFSDLTTATTTERLGDVKFQSDTFVGFDAPVGETITGFRIETFDVAGAPVSTRFGIDQLGFVAVVPEPASAGAILTGVGLLAGRRRR